MQKKYSLLALAFVLILGTIVASLPIRPAKAIGPGEVRFYIWNPARGDNIYDGTDVFPPPLFVEVWIESDAAWDYTDLGIVGWGLSVRVDPRALRILTAEKIPGQGGFLEDFLVRYYLHYTYSTKLYKPIGLPNLDPDGGEMIDVSEFIDGYETLGLGAGGGPIPLMRFVFVGLNATLASPIDLAGRWNAALQTIEVTAFYTTPDGVDHYVDVLDDGHYVAPTPNTMWFDAPPGGYDPANPIGPDWHELLPAYSSWWSLDDWTDNGDGVLSASDQIYMWRVDPPPFEDHWFHVDWLRDIAKQKPGDGKKDMIVTIKPPDVPEFPLGVALMIAIAPAIPIVYLWRTRKKVRIK